MEAAQGNEDPEKVTPERFSARVDDEWTAVGEQDSAQSVRQVNVNSGKLSKTR